MAYKNSKKYRSEYKAYFGIGKSYFEAERFFNFCKFLQHFGISEVEIRGECGSIVAENEKCIGMLFPTQLLESVQNGEYEDYLILNI